MTPLFLTMKQAAEFTGVPLKAIRDHRAIARWIWECAVKLSGEEAKRPTYGWRQKELEIAALNLPRYTPVAEPVRGQKPVMVKTRTGNKKSADVLPFISHEDHIKEINARMERQRLRMAKRRALNAAAAI